ncbi:MAG: two-component system response regulator [Clostridiaceae bacterium]|jgi:two-component system chemotaxis response regulator CheY|nr:two-component system response regulator [Clostridiaceae bacterium]
MGVLIVDDSQFMRMIIKKILEQKGIKVVEEAINGYDAIEKYKKFKPEVVTMDLTMQGISGIETVESILKYDPNAKIIICSAMGQKSVINEAIKVGAKGFVIKPFEEEDFLKEFFRVMNG